MRRKSFDNVHVDELLVRAIEADDGDLYLRHGLPPFTGLRDGQPAGVMSEYGALTPFDIQVMVYGILPDDQIRQFERDGAITFSYALSRAVEFEVRFVLAEGGDEAHFRRA